MTPTMTVLACFLTLSLGFILGHAYKAYTSKASKVDGSYRVERIINLLQLKLITENDHRGFQTRTQVSAWLKRMGPEVSNDIAQGNKRGRETI